MIPKSGLEIKNRCTQEGLNGEKLASIPKFGPEIKNRCSSKPVLEAGHSSSQQRRIESDAEDVAATSAAVGPFFFAAAKIRIGCGHRCCHGHCRRAILLCCSED